MDPISIITLAASATQATYTVSVQIYSFINAAKSVDESITTLASELSALRRSLDAIGIVLKNPLVKSERATASENVAIWAALAGALEDCRRTLQTFENEIQPFTAAKNKRYFMRKSVTAWKLNVSQDSINTIRTQVHTHSINLQIALQMVNILLSSLSPVQAVEDLGTRLDDLTKGLDSLSLSSKGGDDVSSSARVRAAASMMVAKAPEFVTTGLLDAHNEDERKKATESLKSVISEFNKSFYGSDPDQPPQYSVSDDDDSDSEDDFKSNLAKEILQKARASFKNRKYQDAERFYRDALRHYSEMSQIKDQDDLTASRLDLATCCFLQEKFGEAELMFLMMAKDEGETNPRTLQACHYLAGVYLGLYNFESALEYATMAVNGRKRLLGKKHPDYYSSVRLLSLVYEANGDFATASAYFKKLPKDYQEQPENAFVVSEFSGYSSADHLQMTLLEKREALWELCEIDIFHNTRRPDPVYVMLGGKRRLKRFDPKKDALDFPKALRWAALENKPLLTKWLLAKMKGTDGLNDALVESGWKGSTEVAGLLLDSGANIEAGGSSDRTALYWSSLWGYESTVRLFLERGAKVDRPMEEGETALMAAACKGHTSILRILLDAGADIHLRNTRYNELSALDMAIDNNLVPATKVLMEEMRDLKGADRYGNLLHQIVGLHDLSLVELALKYGLSVSQRNRAGATCLPIACSDQYIRTIQFLIDHGADVNAMDDDGETALSKAVDRDAGAAVKLLLESGADPNLRKEGSTSFYPYALAKHRWNSAATKAFNDWQEKTGAKYKICDDDAPDDEPCKTCHR